MQQPTNQDSGAASEIRQDAQQLGSTAANRLHSEVDARKGAAVSQAQSVSSAITQTAEGLGEGSPEWLKSALQQGAQQIQRFADTIEQKDSRQMMSEAQNFARNNPGTFLAACAAVGFAAARVLKAGGEQQRTQQFNETQPSGGNPSFGQPQAFQAPPQPARTPEPAYGASVSGAGMGAGAPGRFA
jgi:ElaB/YqjD/DUF883 family membrane-anchored ribosome-binding protein